MYTSDLKHRAPALEQKLQRLYTLSRGKTIDLSFRPPYLELLEKFGNPHLKLPPTIHIAGTNGKGSTLATLKSIYEAAGYKVHAYTSPHLVDFNERIYLAGENIDDEFLNQLIDEALALNAEHEITFFEITTAMAFAAFSRTSADILLLEVGMGGRLDCTNVIENPIATIITSIGFDHAEHLGSTLSDIAREKAGIMKNNVPCIIGTQRDGSVLSTFEHIAMEKEVPLSRFGSEWFSFRDTNHLLFKSNNDLTLPLPNLKGVHQLYNAGCALAAIERLQHIFPVKNEALSEGLTKIHWPARLQNLTTGFSLPTGWEIWLDGGHNEDAAHTLAQQAIEWDLADPKDLHVICAMLQGKDSATFLDILRPHLASLSLTEIGQEPKALKNADIKAMLGPGFLDLPVILQPDFRPALEYIAKTCAPGRILITGSLYLAGHVLKNLDRSA